MEWAEKLETSTHQVGGSSSEVKNSLSSCMEYDSGLQINEVLAYFPYCGLKTYGPTFIHSVSTTNSIYQMPNSLH